MKKEILKKVKELDEKDLTKIIEIFDTCQECWNSENPETCRYQKVRLKIGLDDCEMVKLKKSRN